jgi:hypothetical protein
MRGFIVLTIMAGAPALVSAIDLQANTVEAWDAYVRNADSRLQTRIEARQPFLWVDESPDRIARVRRGEVVITPVAGDGTRDVPNGLIHDWIGAVFIPGATIDSLYSVMHDYGRYKDYYKPVVADSKAIGCTSTAQEFSMVWKHRAMLVTTVIQSRYEGHDVEVDARRGYNVTGTTEVRQIEDYGHSGAHALPAGTGNGFIWRLHSLIRYEERDGGVYLELEAMALSRDIPGAVRGLVKPLVNHLSINSLTTTLHQTRDAVNASVGAPKQFAMCPKTGGNSETIISGGD